MESAASIRASYLRQRPDALTPFVEIASVEGPPVIATNQMAEENFRRFQVVHFTTKSRCSHLLLLFPLLGCLLVLLNSSTGEISGVPLQEGIIK